MKVKEFINIMRKCEKKRVDFDNDMPIYDGLTLLHKYIPNADIHQADDGLVFTEPIYDICEAGITKDDVIMLYKLGWWFEDDDEDNDETDEYIRLEHHAY